MTLFRSALGASAGSARHFTGRLRVVGRGRLLPLVPRARPLGEPASSDLLRVLLGVVTALQAGPSCHVGPGP